VNVHVKAWVWLRVGFIFQVRVRFRFRVTVRAWFTLGVMGSVWVLVRVRFL